MRPARWAALVVVLAALVFAVEGGEYGTWDWLGLRRREREEIERIAQLHQTVDSLGRAAQALEQDPRTQERAARELFGMIRKGEFLYRIPPPAEP